MEKILKSQLCPECMRGRLYVCEIEFPWDMVDIYKLTINEKNEIILREEVVEDLVRRGLITLACDECSTRFSVTDVNTYVKEGY